jgi:SAM-dependent methyltransferase
VPIDDLSLAQLRDLAETAVLVAAASDAGIFEALYRAPASPAELAAGLGYDERATRITLLALEAAGLLEKRGDRFAPTERWARELGDADGPGFAGRGLPHWLRSVRASTRLREALERGGPLDPRPRHRSPERVARFTAAMSAAPRERVERVVDLCLDRRPGAERVLDLGGGPGHVTRAFVARGLRGTLLDTEDIVAHVVPAYGLQDVEGLDVVSADFNRDPLPSGPFDVVLLSNVIHIYDGSTIRTLFANAADTLKPGGVLAVAEFLRGRSTRAAQLGLQMLLKSEAGDTYSEEQIGGWMREAGLSELHVDGLDEERYLITAVRP